METRAWVTGDFVWAAAAAIGALPSPDSFEKTPRAIPILIASITAAPAKPPVAMECYLMSGDADYLLRVICKDNDDYIKVHSMLTNLPGVQRVHSSFALRTVVKKTDLPIRITNSSR
jgi:DNA-binding Lrp family transcriptional regulator